jgi:hypothetical protein
MGSIEEKAPAKCPMRLANVGGGGQKVGLHRHNIYILSYWGQCVLTRHVEP